MSCCILKSTIKNTDSIFDNLVLIDHPLFINSKGPDKRALIKGKSPNIKIIKIFCNYKKVIVVPKSFGILNFDFISTNYYLKMDIQPILELRETQLPIKMRAIDILEEKNTVIISMPCGFGKTILSLNIASELKYSTLIIVNKIILMNQWEEEIKNSFENPIIYLCPTKCSLKTLPFAHFYIINAINLEKYKDQFTLIGTVIVDELHQLMTEKLTKGLFYVWPKYLIGLSATPTRPDIFNKLIPLFFGGEDNIVSAQFFKKHIVNRINTGFTPIIEYSWNPKIQRNSINWNVLLDSISKNEKRNNLIVNIVKNNENLNILILVKRVEQGLYLADKIKEFTTVTTLLGKNQTFDESARVLIGTTQKVGTGFNHPKLNSIIIAIDLLEYFIQALARCFRRLDVSPVIFDLVDNHSSLEKHWDERKKVYISSGGIIN